MRARLPRLSDHPRAMRGILRHPRRAGGALGGTHRMPGAGGAAPAEAGPGAHRAPASRRPRTLGEEAEAAAELTPEERHREGAVPEDNAYYACPACGYTFEARVSTSVHCPHCGDTQAW